MVRDLFDLWLVLTKMRFDPSQSGSMFHGWCFTSALTSKHAASIGPV